MKRGGLCRNKSMQVRGRRAFACLDTTSVGRDSCGEDDWPFYSERTIGLNISTAMAVEA